MNREQYMDIFQKTGVYKEGHFELSSGRHSDAYMQCAQLLQYPNEAEKVGIALANLFQDLAIDVVVGPALGGIVIAYEVARALGVRSVFTERKKGQMEMRRGFSIQPEERVLIIEDVVTTGGSVHEVIQLLESFDVKPVAVGSIVDRSQGKVSFPCLYRSCIQMEVKSYLPADCPLCKEGVPIYKPGSREKQLQKV